MKPKRVRNEEPCLPSGVLHSGFTRGNSTGMPVAYHVLVMTLVWISSAQAACNNTDTARAMTTGCCLQLNTLSEGCAPPCLPLPAATLLLTDSEPLFHCALAVWVDSGIAIGGTSTGSAGVDNSTCGAAESPCLSVKWAYHIRVTNDGTVKLKAGTNFSGPDNRYHCTAYSSCEKITYSNQCVKIGTHNLVSNLCGRDLRDASEGTDGAESCTRKSANIEGESVSNRYFCD